uniref:Ankyrin repeat protein n=1 Tax=Marseillevirus LCMAC202 TaxID=2506606 RepID=A0A481YYQ5_9VIRU|nr:MAG: ankyrin repeat protein [Marseillevirus LCMAC202]
MEKYPLYRVWKADGKTYNVCCNECLESNLSFASESKAVRSVQSAGGEGGEGGERLYNNKSVTHDAFEQACIRGSTDIVRRFLADVRADPAASNNWAVQRSSEEGHVGIVQLLLADARVDPTANDNKAIKISSTKGHVDVVQLLLADGRADPAANDDYAVRISVENEHTEVVRLLLTDTRVVPDADRIMEDFLLVDNELQAKVEAADRIMEDFVDNELQANVEAADRMEDFVDNELQANVEAADRMEDFVDNELQAKVEAADRMEDFVDNELQAKVEAADRIMKDFTMDDNEKPRVEVDPHFSPTLGNKKREEEAAEKRRKENEEAAEKRRKENEKNADINFLAVRIVNRDPEEWKAILTLLFYHHTSNLQHIKYQNIKSASPPNASDFYILCRALEEVANAGFGAIDSFCGLLVSHGYKVMNSDVDLMRTINVHSQYYYSHYMDTGEKLYVKEDWDAMLLENLELGKKKFAEYEKKEQLYRNKREKQRKQRKERKEAAEKERKEAVEKLYVVTGTVPVVTGGAASRPHHTTARGKPVWCTSSASVPYCCTY